MLISHIFNFIWRYLRVIASYTTVYSESEQSDSLSDISTRTPCGFLHKLLLPMQWHVSEHDKPVFLHEQCIGVSRRSLLSPTRYLLGLEDSPQLTRPFSIPGSVNWRASNVVAGCQTLAEASHFSAFGKIWGTAARQPYLASSCLHGKGYTRRTRIWQPQHRLESLQHPEELGYSGELHCLTVPAITSFWWLLLGSWWNHTQ